jgi:hypothetical protein
MRHEIAELQAEVKELSQADGLPNKTALYVHAIKTIVEQKETIERLQAIVDKVFKIDDGRACPWCGGEEIETITGEVGKLYGRCKACLNFVPYNKAAQAAKGE